MWLTFCGNAAGARLRLTYTHQGLCLQVIFRTHHGFDSCLCRGEKRADQRSPIHHYITQGLRADDGFSSLQMNDNTAEHAPMHNLRITPLKGSTAISFVMCFIKCSAGFCTCEFSPLDQCCYFQLILNRRHEFLQHGEPH